MRTMLNDAPLRRQLLVWLLLPIATVWLASAYVTYTIAYRFATSAYDRALFDSAMALAGQVRIDRGRVVVDLPRIAQKVLESDLRDRVYYMVSGPDGEFVMGYRGMPLPPPGASVAARADSRPVLRSTDPVTAQTPVPSLSSADGPSGRTEAVAASSTDVGRTTRYYDAEYRGQELRIAALSVGLSSISGGELDGEALVQVGETLIDRREMARGVLVATLLPQLALMLLLAAIVYLAVGRGLAPLDALRREIESRSSRDLAPVKEDRAPPEVRRLVRSLNDLLVRLAQTLAAQQRFIADAAHQLRTPTAALKTQVELAQRSGDPAQTQARLAQILAATERNARLVNQLLSLARAEPGGTEPIAHRPLDLVALAREATEQWVPQAIARSIDLGFDDGPDSGAGPAQTLLVEGDAVMLAEMLGNLIDNALRYTHPGGAVTVSVMPVTEAARPMARISVDDDGPGIDPAERERVFERFHRILGTGTEGAGLGLSIVREIALSHGGRVELEDGAGGTGTRAVITLPALT
jgi:two-component system sensor histidine kinase TctE